MGAWGGWERKRASEATGEAQARSAALAARGVMDPAAELGRLWEIFWVPKHSEHLTLDATAQKSLRTGRVVPALGTLC